MSDLINVSLCLTDIPKEKITTSANGKKYLNVSVARRLNADQYGNTHSVSVAQNKEERENKQPKTYIGSGKEVVFNNTQKPTSTTTSTTPTPTAEDDDLPF